MPPTTVNFHIEMKNIHNSSMVFNKRHSFSDSQSIESWILEKSVVVTLVRPDRGG